MGGTVAAVLFAVGKKLFALYLTHAGTASAFGAAGSLAVLMMWLYFAAAVLLLGAEAASSRIEERHGDARPQEQAHGQAASASAVLRPSNETVQAAPAARIPQYPRA